MKHYVISTIFIVFWLMKTPVWCQNWTNIQQWGGIGTEICSGLTIDRDGSVWMAGSFENQITFENQVLNAIGEDDIFICKLQSNGEIAWAKRAGSRLEDEIADIVLDTDDNLVVIGSYWLEGDFDAIKLTAGANPKAIFIAKYAADGSVLWAKSLNGTGLKGVEAVVCDAENNILLTGYFEKNLQIGDTLLSAKGTTDLFLAKFNSDGAFLWAVQQGKKGDTRGTALGLTSDGDAIVAGYFNDTTHIADTILTANTQDQDAFIVRFDQNGTPLWAKKAGGVFDSDVTGLVLDEANNIYLTGYFVGTMRLSPQLSIQSSSGNSDFFLLKYDVDGMPIAARALGGRLLEQALDFTIQNNILIVSGFYQGDMNLDGFSFSTGGSLSSFIAGFDTGLQCQWAKNLASDAFLYASQIAANANGDIVVGGSFMGKATLDPLHITGGNSFDLFLARAQQEISSAWEMEHPVLFRVFPNPTDGKVFIATELTKFSLRVTNAAGQLVFNTANQNTLDLSHLPKGTYFLSFQGNFISQVFKVVWN